MTTQEIDDADEFAPTRTTKVPNKRSTAHNDAMQQHIMRCLETSGQAGSTNREIVEYLKKNFDPDAYDSPTSGATSRMHKDGIIVRLLKKRGDRVVYVHPNHVPADARIVQPKQKEASVFGTKTKDTSREEVEAVQEKLRQTVAEAARLKVEVYEANELVARLQTERDQVLESAQKFATERNDAVEALSGAVNHAAHAEGERDGALNELSAVRAERDNARSALELAAQERERLSTRVGDLQTRLDQAEVETASVPQGPRKTFTHDEQRLVKGVARVLREKYPHDGTPDNPARITLKVSTVRGIVRGALRVVSD
jgi:uncharacterized coiled-coil DUF342 family protein